MFLGNPFANPFKKTSIFRLFEFLVFIAQKRVLSFQNIVKDIFLAFIAKEEELQNWPFLDQYHRLTPLESRQFIDFLNYYLFLQPTNEFFVLEYRKRDFHGLYCRKKELEKGPLLDQNHGLTLLEKCQFFDF